MLAAQWRVGLAEAQRDRKNESERRREGERETRNESIVRAFYTQANLKLTRKSVNRRGCARGRSMADSSLSPSRARAGLVLRVWQPTVPVAAQGLGCYWNRYILIFALGSSRRPRWLRGRAAWSQSPILGPGRVCCIRPGTPRCRRRMP